MKKVTILVGPPGSGKTTYRNKLHKENYGKCLYVSQDEQGKEQHYYNYTESLKDEIEYIIVDRMNFNKEQRAKYLAPAKEAGYETEIIVLHESHETCMDRCLSRTFHETIKTEENASKAIYFFFKSYERPTEQEADVIRFVYPEVHKHSHAIICDIDGTLANIDHRTHFVQGEKKDWKAFFGAMNKDTVNQWCKDILREMANKFDVVMCSGRPDDHREVTNNLLIQNHIPYDHLFMRARNDFRSDTIIKEIILDFEILTRYKVLFALDDRDSVVKMWRSRGITCLQCDEGQF